VHFGEKTVAETMTPRAQVFALDAALPPDEPPACRRRSHGLRVVP